MKVNLILTLVFSMPSTTIMAGTSVLPAAPSVRMISVVYGESSIENLQEGMMRDTESDAEEGRRGATEKAGEEGEEGEEGGD